ncbi:MAG TPA: phosphatase PAP2 family protein [Streptosporangiaceae bacterium]|nr:phosphatase PAP2 family protein [Streptosporangiaceae bacterium]
MTSARTNTLRPYEHFAWRSVAGLITIIAGATGFGLLLLLVRDGWPPLVSFDRSAVDTLNHAVVGDRIAITVLTAITGLGRWTILFWLVTVSTAVMLIRRQYQLTAYLVVTGLGALALDPAIKALVERLRPMVPAPVATAPGYSFPSGHTLDATVFYGVMLLVFLPIIPRRLRKLAIGLVIALVVAIGFSRVAIGVHYPSDVIGGWLLGVAWLGVTAHAFGHWRAETGQPPRHLSQGLAPEAAPQLGPARVVPVAHPGMIATRLVVSFVLIGGSLFGLGKLITAHPPAFDEAVPRWLASHRTPQLDTLSSYLSQAGNTHWILAVGLIMVPLALALIRRWRPAVFVVVLMLGELGLFVGVAGAVHRARPLVTHLDGHLPTSAFPSGHTAATMCLYGALAVLVVPRVRGAWRWLAVTPAVLMTALVGWSRIYRGEHHPLDVAGGILLALLWLAAAAFALRPNADLDEPDSSPAQSPPAVALPAPGVSGQPANLTGPERDNGMRPAVVANPAKVTSTARSHRELRAALASAGWPQPLWLETTCEDPGGGQTRQAVQAGAEVIFACGGDGTVTACASELAGTDTPLAVVPAGTGNLLAANLKLPGHPADAVATALRGARRRLDVGVVEGRCFTVMAGMGFDAQMLRDTPETLKARLGWPAYVVAAARHLCETPMQVSVSLDGAPPFTRRARSVLVGNVGELRGGLRLLPDARPDDGLLDVAVLMPPRRRSWLPLAWSLIRHRPTAPLMETFQAKQVEIVSDRQQPREFDGDLLEPSQTLTATVRPAALWVCVPRPRPAGTKTSSDNAWPRPYHQVQTESAGQPR